MYREGRFTIPQNGHELHYSITGDGPVTIVALHGGPGLDSRYMDGFRRLANADRRVVLYDQLGGGRSDRPSDDSLWTIEGFADELETVRDGLELGTIHLVGHSWGGMLALQYALDHPKALASLTLSHHPASAAEILASAEDGRNRLAVGDYSLMRQLEVSGEIDRADYQALLTDIYSRGFRRSTPFDLERSRRELVEQVMPLLDDSGPDPRRVMWGPNEFSVTGNLLSWNVHDRLSELRVPTLVLTSWHDEIQPRYVRRMAEGIAQSELIIFGRSSHMIMFEHEADAYFGAISHFIERVSSGKAPPGDVGTRRHSPRDSVSEGAT